MAQTAKPNPSTETPPHERPGAVVSYPVPHIVLSIHKNKAIYCLTIQKLSGRNIVEAYFNWQKTHVQNWPVEKPFLLMYDSRNLPLNWSPYIRQQSDEVTALVQARGLKGRMAIVLPHSMLNRMLQIYIASVRRYQKPSVEPSIFFEYDSAFAWLEQLL